MELTISLSTTINEDEDTTLADIIEDENSNLDNIGQITDKVMLQRILDIAALGERDDFIIKARFGFYGRIYTLHEVGEKLGLTRERVRQLEKKAIIKLKRASEKKYFVKPESYQEYTVYDSEVLELGRNRIY
jgi:RNA polymerase primary sigma factor